MQAAGAKSKSREVNAGEVRSSEQQFDKESHRTDLWVPRVDRKMVSEMSTSKIAYMVRRVGTRMMIPIQHAYYCVVEHRSTVGESQD